MPTIIFDNHKHGDPVSLKTNARLIMIKSNPPKRGDQPCSRILGTGVMLLRMGSQRISISPRSWAGCDVK